jgi:hypothetical protein
MSAFGTDHAQPLRTVNEALGNIPLSDYTLRTMAATDQSSPIAVEG